MVSLSNHPPIAKGILRQAQDERKGLIGDFAQALAVKRHD
jgi:hypothetical protein